MVIVPELDFKKTVEEIVDFIREVVEDAKASGIVIGLSGGVDSSLTTALCVEALGETKVLGVMMPTYFTPKEDMEDARELAEYLGMETKLIDISDVCEAFFKALHANSQDSESRIPMGNVGVRVRMTILYYYANTSNYLVAGPSDRSEALIGYFTKYGDGGADLYPIVHLYKTQVRELAKNLGIPERISYKPSSPQIYPGHKATDEIPVDYDKLDRILVGLFDRRLSPEETSLLTGASIETVDEVLRRFNRSEHKRSFPPMVKRWRLD